MKFLYKKKSATWIFLFLLMQILSLDVMAQGGTLPLNGSVSGTLSSSTTTDTLNLTTTGDGLLILTFQSTVKLWKNKNIF